MTVCRSVLGAPCLAACSEAMYLLHERRRATCKQRTATRQQQGECESPPPQPQPAAAAARQCPSLHSRPLYLPHSLHQVVLLIHDRCVHSIGDLLRVGDAVAPVIRVAVVIVGHLGRDAAGLGERPDGVLVYVMDPVVLGEGWKSQSGKGGC